MLTFFENPKNVMFKSFFLELLHTFSGTLDLMLHRRCLLLLLLLLLMMMMMLMMMVITLVDGVV